MQSSGSRRVGVYGRGGEISSNRQEEVEMTALCLRILQAALVYVNTLMLQDILAEEQWAGLLGPATLARPDPAVLAARSPVRRGPPQHGLTAQHRRTLATALRQ
jgi:hypothetical protein